VYNAEIPGYAALHSEDSMNTSTATNTAPIDFKYIIERAKLVMTNPTGCWDSIAAEQTTVKELFVKYAAPLAAIPAICGFIGLAIIGVQVPVLGTWHSPFIPQLLASLVQYGASLAMMYVAALVIQQISPKMGGSNDLVSALKLMIYSSTPVWLAGVLSIVPLLGILSILFSFYGLFLFYSGCAKVLALPEDAKLKFTVVATLCILVVSFVLGLLLAGVTPHPNIGG
jgi:hypothetical protein